MRRTQSGKYFDAMLHDIGEIVELGSTLMVVATVEQGIAVDEYGDEDYGWFHTLRPATTEEIAEYERQRAEWEAMTPEERTSETMSMLAAFFPGLDWGDNIPEPKED